MERQFEYPLVIEVDFKKDPQIPLDKSWFVLNNRKCRLLYTDRFGASETRYGRFEYEDGETFTVEHRALYGTVHHDKSHEQIYWNRIVGWSLCY